MSWRATPSRPAAPTVSLGPDSIFAGSNTSTRNRSIATSSRASSSNLRATDSLRSIDTRSSGEGGSDSTSLRSVRTVVRGKERSARSVSDSTREDKGKEKERIVTPPSESRPKEERNDVERSTIEKEGERASGTTAVKRQKLSTPPEPVESAELVANAVGNVSEIVNDATSPPIANSTWFGTASWLGVAKAIPVSVTPAPPLDSSPPTNMEITPPPTASTSSASSLSAEHIPTPPVPTAPSRRPNSSTAQRSSIPRRQSWFGSYEKEPTEGPPVSHLSTSASSSTLRRSPTTPATIPPESSSTFVDPPLLPPSSSSVRTTSTTASTPLGSAPYRSWISTITLSRSAVRSAPDSPVIAPTQAQEIVNAVRSQAIPAPPSSASSTLSSSSRSSSSVTKSSDDSMQNDDTVKARAAPMDLDDSTVTPRPTRNARPSIANQRASWWKWTAPEPLVESVVEEIAEEEEVETPTVEAVKEEVEGEMEVDTPIPTPIAAAPTKTWMQSFWGDHSDAPMSTTTPTMVSYAAGLSSSSDSAGSIKSIELPPPIVVQAPPATPTAAVSTAGPLDSLKSKASWALFPRKPSVSGTTTPTNDSSLPPPSSSAQTSSAPSSLFGKASQAALGSYASSSRASNRSIRTDSAPNSPLLAPQSDATSKPLTGSIRISSRPSTSDFRLDEGEELENLVLPTFGDSFLKVPRSCPPRKSALTKAVSATVSVMSAYLFSQPAVAAPMERGNSRAGDCAQHLPKSYEIMAGEGGVRPGMGKIRDGTKVLCIGVSGWFPNPRLKSVFGEPTGTSSKFVTMMHDSVQSYLEKHNVSSFNIQAIALEGSGIVADRVQNLFQQLTAREDWVDALRHADHVFIATHSQGTVVSTHLLRKIIEKGYCAGLRLHLLAMCGIIQGPFAYLSESYALSPYFSYLESAAARELFDFQSPSTAVSEELLHSLRTILAHGVKITAIGSINDQVVPLYSALFAGISHPGLLRAVYIDSAAFRTSDFLVNLVVFACRLKNAGSNDHDLLFHLSEALAGALTGVGHSKLYEETDVFDLAIRYQFETTQLVEGPTYLNSQSPPPPLTMSFNPKERRNPYLLTWSLRGIVEDAQVRELFGDELTALREAFETWRPTTKVLKEVKLKLEGVRMLPRAKREGGKL